MKRKFVFLVIIAIVLCMVLTGCTNKEEKEQKEETVTTGDSEVAQVTETKTNETKEEIEDASSELENLELYSDNTKIVFKNGQTRMVFYYSGDKITAYHAYIEYPDIASATAAVEEIKKNNDDIEKVSIKGKYLVIEYKKSAFEDLTLSNLKLVYSYLEEVKK